MKRKTCAKFISLKASYPLIRPTRVPNLGRWIIYPESIKNSYIIEKIQIQRKNKTVFIPDKAHKQNLPPYQHKVCEPIWNISHIVSVLLHCGLQRNDKYITHYQRSSSSVESPAKGTVRSVSESDGVTDEVGSRQTTLFCLFEGPRRAFDASRLILNLVECLIFFFWVAPTKFLYELVILFTVPPRRFGCRFRLGTALISDARRALAEVNDEKLAELNDGWSLVFTKAGWFTGAVPVSSEARGKSCGLKIFLSQGKRPIARKPLAAISSVAARLYALPNCSPIC